MGRPRARLGLLALALLASFAVAGTAVAALEGNENARGGQLLIGNDDDDPANATIQPPGVAANQSLRKGDQLVGGRGADVLIGRLGPDTLLSGVDEYKEKGDVIVGGTERGSDVNAFPPSDIAKSGFGDDTFIWAPGDGSDAFIGGEPPSRVTVYKRKRIRVGNRTIRILRKVRVKTKDDTDTLVLGSMLLSPGDNTQPRLFDSRFGQLPKVFASDRNLPTSLSDTTPTPPIIGFCEIVRAPAGLGYDHLVRFFVEATGVQAVTIRVKGVEQVLCGTRNEDGITQTSLGRRGNSDPRVVTTDFQPRAGSKLDALVD
jgi:Ca2+-binding RTX toxin-like protein